MRRRGLHALQPKAFTPRTTDSPPGLQCAPNRLLNQLKPTQVWVSHITYLPLATGEWAYLCAFQDVVSKPVVGWHVTGHDARRTGHHGSTTRFLGATADAGPARAFRLRRAVLRQRLPPTFEPGKLGDAGPNILAFPGIKPGLAQAVLAHNVSHRLPAGLLLEESHNLSLAESSFFHFSVVR